jgi:23S rRNA (cytosine1962-C5)-methyltransferase
MPNPAPLASLAGTVTLQQRGARRWVAGHPWIYESDVQPAKGIANGDVVRVIDSRQRCLGQAYYSAVSRIRLRRVTLDERPIDAGFFRERIAAADRLRQTLLPGETAYRVVHGEADGLPGLVVDRYGDYLCAQFLVAATDRRRELIVDALVGHFRCTGLVNRSDLSVRQLEGLEQQKGVLHGEVPEEVLITEGGRAVAVDLLGGQKTGGFLDQRQTRIAAGRYAHGRALDCFSYTGGFALQLAARADSVTAVEISETACERIRANVARNRLANVTVTCANVFDYLRAQHDAGERYDTIVLDPPAFVKQKSALAAAVRGYKEINQRALRLLSPGGCLVTSSCSHHVDEDAFEALLQEAAADAHRDVQVLERRGPGPDHPVLLAMRETRYLKTSILRVL